MALVNKAKYNRARVLISFGHVGVVVEGGNIISNSSGGFQGDKKGQIELNYNLNTWDSVTKRNPQKTASFRYKGPYKKEWGKADRPLA